MSEDAPTRTARWFQGIDSCAIRDASGRVIKTVTQPGIHIEVEWMDLTTADAIRHLDYAYRQVRAQLADDPTEGETDDH